MAVGAYALVTLSELKSWLGITASTNDAVLETSIDHATAIIEQYLDRRIAERTHREWVDPRGQGTIVVNQWPITSIKTIAYGAADSIILSIDDPNDVLATVENDGSSLKFNRIDSAGSSSSSSLSFATYPTTSQLVTQINSSVTGFSASLTKNAYSYSLHRFGGRGLVEATMNLTYARDNISEYRVEFETARIHMRSDRFPNYRDDYRFTNRFPSSFQSVFVEYTAGYATIPDDIKQVCFDVASDMYQLRLEDTTKNSESIGDYSYSRTPSADRHMSTLERLIGYRSIR
jgi:hypothetical protein